MSFNKFFENIQKDLKTYIFLLVLFCVYRGYFMWYMRDFMSPEAGSSDILLAMWIGFRLSLKSAGAFTLLSFLICTIPNIVWPKIKFDKLRVVLATIYTLFLSILFQARFPYYREFHTTFNQQVINGFHDDVNALFITMIQQYNLPLRLFTAFVLVYIFYRAIKFLLATPTFSWPVFATRKMEYLAKVSIIVFIPIFMLFMRFGASFNYTYSVNWENAGITKDTFLNECILDDIQAMYRAYSSNERTKDGKISGLDQSKILQYSQQVAGHTNLTSNDITPYLERTAQGPKIKKPKHIFIILGESWAQWPMLEKYKALHVADGIKGLIKEDNAFYTRSFMPNGTFTSAALTGVITGLTDVSIYPNYQPRSFQEPYITAIAPQFHKLGYKVDFWYAGFPSWDRMKDFSIAQGFDAFFGCPDYNAPKQNIWGTKDGYLFDALEEHVASEEPTVHLVMTSTNHPPYNLDLEQEGFDVNKELAALPVEASDRDELAKELGHYWYMDKIVTQFVKTTMEKYPDSLFIITGDHADRMNLNGTPTLFERHSIPLLIYGQGVTKDLLPKEVSGSHTNLFPTLMELIAPKGFEYYSIAESMTTGTEIGFNRIAWISKNGMGLIDTPQQELLPDAPAVDLNVDREKAGEKVSMMRTISWWLLEKGTMLEGNE